MRKFSKILFFVLAALSAASCIYDYNPQIDGEGGYMVVQGNLVIGEISTVSTSWSWSLVDTAQGDERWQILNSSRMHVEASDGTRYENQYNQWPSLMPYISFLSGSPYGSFDLREADPALSYRLVIENARGTYASEWAAPLSPGVLDSLSYRISEDKTQMAILVASRGDSQDGSYYRWTVQETWEYHAQTRAFYKYLLDTREVVPLDADENYYACWATGQRPEILTATTKDLLEDKLVDHQLYTLANTDSRVSVIYSAEVRQMRLPEEAYRYWQTMERNSSDVGGLFSPEPSELRGNVVNLDDPDEMVLGYVGVMQVASKRLFVKNYESRFYRTSMMPRPALDTLSNPDDWQRAFRTGMRPVTEVFNEESGRWLGYEWWPAYCVDCRLSGGTSSRPDFWPN